MPPAFALEPRAFDGSPVSCLIDMRSALDWFSGLNIGQKGLAVLFGGLLQFSVIYLVTSGVLWVLFARAPRGRRRKAELATPNKRLRQAGSSRRLPAWICR